MGRKTTVWIFQGTNKQNLTQKDLDRIKKGNENLKRETESLLRAWRNNTIRTNYELRQK